MLSFKSLLTKFTLLYTIVVQRGEDVNGNRKRTTVSISCQTKEELDKLKHPGQSYDGLFKELLGFWVEEHEYKAIARKTDDRGAGK